MTRMAPLATFAVLMLGCFDHDPHGCERVGCADGVDVVLTQSRPDFPAGSYVVEWILDGRSSACTFEVLPTEPGTCDASFDLDADPATVTVFVRWMPADVEVRVLRDGAEVGGASFQPRYETEHMDVGGCAVECARSEAIVQVD